MKKIDIRLMENYKKKNGFGQRVNSLEKVQIFTGYPLNSAITNAAYLSLHV